MNMQNSNMTTTVRRQVYVNLTDEEVKNLKKKALEGGQTQQGFVRQAILDALKKGQTK